MSSNRILHHLETTKKNVAAYKEPDPDINQTYHHEPAVRIMVCCIWMSQLHPDIKKFMIYRVWGAYKDNFLPMQTKDIAKVMLGRDPTLKDILAFNAMEVFGKDQMVELLKHKTQEELCREFGFLGWKYGGKIKGKHVFEFMYDLVGERHISEIFDNKRVFEKKRFIV